MPIYLIDKIKQKNSGKFALADAADIAIDDKDTRLDKKLEEIDEKLQDPGESTATSIPTFNMIEMGLPAITTNVGDAMLSGVDTSEIRAALDLGAVNFIFMIDIEGDGESSTVEAVMTKYEDDTGYLCNTVIRVGTVTHTVNIYFITAGEGNGIIGVINPITCLPDVAHPDNDKILQVVDGEWTAVNLEDSAIKTYIDDYINEALGGDY